MNDLTVKQKFNLEKMPEKMNKDIAWNIAQMIEDAESDVRLAKGKFWNRCEHGTREEICDHFGWKYEGMRKYGMYAQEMVKIGSNAPVSFTQWQRARSAKVSQPERVELFNKAAEEGWTPEQIDAAIPKVEKKPKVEVFKVNFDAEKAVKEQRNKEQLSNKITMNRREAAALFGLSPVMWISEETLKVLYRYYAKQAHPDNGGNADQMILINTAHDIMKEVSK